MKKYQSYKNLTIFVLFAASLLFYSCEKNETSAQADTDTTPMKVYTFKIQGFVPAGMLYHDTLLMFTENLEKASNGRIKFEVFPAGAICPPFEALDAVNNGVLDVSYANGSQWIGKIPAAGLFTSVAGGFNDVDFYMWFTQYGGMELYQKSYDINNYNVKVFPCGISPMQNFMWSKKPIRSLEDMKGVKMRMMPYMGDVLKEHGFSVAFLPPAEILPSLERGVIDSAEYASSAFDLSAGYYEVCKYYMVPGVHQPSSIIEMLINKDKWNALPEDLKTIWKTCASAHIWELFAYENKKVLEAEEIFKENGNVKIQMDQDTVDQLNKWSTEYMDKLAEKDELFAEVLASQKEFASVWYPYRKNAVIPH